MATGSITSHFTHCTGAGALEIVQLLLTSGTEWEIEMFQAGRGTESPLSVHQYNLRFQFSLRPARHFKFVLTCFS